MGLLTHIGLLGTPWTGWLLQAHIETIPLLACAGASTRAALQGQTRHRTLCLPHPAPATVRLQKIGCPCLRAVLCAVVWQ